MLSDKKKAKEQLANHPYQAKFDPDSSGHPSNRKEFTISNLESSIQHLTFIIVFYYF